MVLRFQSPGLLTITSQGVCNHYCRTLQPCHWLKLKDSFLCFLLYVQRFASVCFLTGDGKIIALYPWSLGNVFKVFPSMQKPSLLQLVFNNYRNAPKAVKQVLFCWLQCVSSSSSWQIRLSKLFVIIEGHSPIIKNYRRPFCICHLSNARKLTRLHYVLPLLQPHILCTESSAVKSFTISKKLRGEINERDIGKKRREFPPQLF